MMVFYMIDYFCFLLHFSKLLEDTYGYDKTTASYINGVLYDTSLLLCPIMGQINVRIAHFIW